MKNLKGIEMVRKWLIATCLLFVGLVTVRAADDPAPLDVEKWSVEAFGNVTGAEARLMRLGPNGGAVGAYVGIADELIDTDDEVVTFGLLGRYDVIQDGNAPVANWLPKALHWFTDILGLPDTTPVDTYVGIAIGGLYRTDLGDEDGSFDWTAAPVIGLKIGPLAGEIAYLLDDQIIGGLPDDIDKNLQWRIGIVFEW